MSAGFLGPGPDGAAARAMAAEDVAEVGYVMNVSRLWAHHPEALTGLFELLGSVGRAVGLGLRDRALLTVATAAAREDAYCALAWGGRLAGQGEEDATVALLHGDPPDLDDRGRALVDWAQRVATAPNTTTSAGVAALRAAGLDDAEIFAATVHVALRAAFSTVNAALGALPDPELVASLPPAVRDAVDFGRR